MGLITIDQQKCRQDGICSEVCPVQIIVPEGEDNYPSLVAGADALCIRCGHCVAVCPHGAIHHADLHLEDFNMAANLWPPLQEALDLPPNETPLGTMMVGYAQYRYQRLVARRAPSIAWR